MKWVGYISRIADLSNKCGADFVTNPLGLDGSPTHILNSHPRSRIIQNQVVKYQL